MFKENTLFVIGAGASSEFGLPTGMALSETIRHCSYFEFARSIRPVAGNQTLFDCLIRKYPVSSPETKELLDERLRALRRIHDGIYLASSIDNFIDMHSLDPLVAEMGKLLIAFTISAAEKDSDLHFEVNAADAMLELPSVKDTWIDSFARILFEKVKHENLDSIGKNIKIICFNYDRCIEYYLIEAIRQTFSEVKYEDAYRIVSDLNIIHPYGTLGSLPDNYRKKDGKSVPFGFDALEGFDPWPAVGNLKTYSEQIEDAELVTLMRKAVEESLQIIFLGFSFQPENMSLMRLEDPSGHKNVYSTGRGISHQEEPEVAQRILDIFAGKTELYRRNSNVWIQHNASCAELLKSNWRRLSAS